MIHFIVSPSVDPKYAAMVEVLSIGFHAAKRSGAENFHNYPNK